LKIFERVAPISIAKGGDLFMAGKRSGIMARYTQACSIISLALALTSFFSTKIFLGFSLSESFVTTILIQGALFVILFSDRQLRISQGLVGFLKGKSLMQKTGLEITRWTEHIDVSSAGNAMLTCILEGRCYGGNNRYQDINIKTDSAQPSRNEGFKVRIFDMTKEEEVEPEYLIDEPHYKRVRINFREAPLYTGAKFRYKTQMKLFSTISLEGQDYWSHQVLSNQKRIEISLNFPSRCVVSHVCGKVHTVHGDCLLVKHHPKKTKQNQIKWLIYDPIQGNSYELNWKLQKKV
jgi:hypothetical protein